MSDIKWDSSAWGTAWFCRHCGATCAGAPMAIRKSASEHKCLIGTVVTTIHGNQLRLFGDGWSPLSGAHWDRWTVYTDAELMASFTLASTT